MAETLRVLKFGGTSVGDADCIRRAARIVADFAARGAVVVVTSAMSGVTDRLIDAANRAEAGQEDEGTRLAEALRAQHEAALRLLVTDPQRRSPVFDCFDRVLSETVRLLHGTALLGEITPRVLDSISSAGERLMAPLLAAALEGQGLRSEALTATEIILTDNRHGGAAPLLEPTRERVQARLRPLLAAGIVPVVTGFIGATSEGTLTTLGRGGSDFTATILGAALGAGETIIWTDVDGVMTADPRLVPEARTIEEISYNEAAELAYFGAKVLHPNALGPVTSAGLPVTIRNSFAPEKPGTRISAHVQAAGGGVKALTAIRDVTMITVGGPGIVGRSDVLARTFTATAGVRANVLLVSQSSSQDDICFVVPSAEAKHTVEALRQTFALELERHQVEHINISPGIAIVAAVGENMRGTPGIAGRTFSTLGREGINIIAIAQGSSEYNISFVVEARAMQQAVAALHREFGLGSPAAAPAGADRSARQPG
jgi:aspartokinase/homoserine dehydrogenase 1